LEKKSRYVCKLHLVLVLVISEWIPVIYYVLMSSVFVQFGIKAVSWWCSCSWLSNDVVCVVMPSWFSVSNLGVKNFPVSSCHSSLKTLSLQFLSLPSKILVICLLAFKFLMKRNCFLHYFCICSHGYCWLSLFVFMSCCVIFHGLSWNKKMLSPSLHFFETAAGSTGIF